MTIDSPLKPYLHPFPPLSFDKRPITISSSAVQLEAESQQPARHRHRSPTLETSGASDTKLVEMENTDSHRGKRRKITIAGHQNEESGKKTASRFECQ